MKKLILLIIAIGLALFLVSYNKKDRHEPVESTPLEQTSEKVEVGEVTDDESPEQELVSDNYYLGGLDAGFVSMTLAKYSPTLTEEEKRAIAQDFYGAPNDMPASRYFVIAEKVTCVRMQNSDSIVDCTVIYPGTDMEFFMSSEDSARLFIILGDLSPALVNGTIRVQQINCSVDDYVVQTSSGDNIQGFDCDLVIES